MALGPGQLPAAEPARLQLVAQLIEPERIYAGPKWTSEHFNPKSAVGRDPGFLSCEATPEHEVHNLLEGSPASMGQIAQLGSDIVIQGQRRPHMSIMMPRREDVKMRRARWARSLPHVPSSPTAPLAASRGR